MLSLDFDLDIEIDESKNGRIVLTTKQGIYRKQQGGAVVNLVNYENPEGLSEKIFKQLIKFVKDNSGLLEYTRDNSIPLFINPIIVEDSIGFNITIVGKNYEL